MDEILTPEQWNVFRIQLRQKHPELTNADLPYYEARESDMLCMVEYRIQNYKEEMAQNSYISGTYQR